MCGRYNIHDDPWLQTLLRELGLDVRIPSRANIAPTEAVPVVIEEQGVRRLREMRWWLVPSWAPEIDQRYSMFNAKAETLGTSRAFRGPLRHRRCILPASSFIEWTPVDGHKQPWLIRPERGAIAFAGLWDVWEKDGNHLESCAIITTGAAPGIDRLHNRMPAGAARAGFRALAGRRNAARRSSDILHSRLPHLFVLAPVSPAVNNSRH
ncbi:MAG: SOS response-associated peptidase [Gammaproteobacteria bacterium]|nr:SOS response-associated peptidase [Gammaproteobacteria bacterium]